MGSTQSSPPGRTPETRLPVPPHVIELVQYPSARYNQIEPKLVALYAEVEPNEDAFYPLDKLKCVVSVLWAKTGELIAFDVLTSMDRLSAGETQESFVAKGGLLERKGLFLTSLAGKRKYKGIAPLMIATNVTEAKRHGFSYILLHVSVPKVRALYESLGFRVVGSFDGMSIMRMDLAAI
jgi:hypothetical protein